MKIIRLFFLLLSIPFTCNVFSQRLINNELFLFEIENEKIAFIVAENVLVDKKPILLFCQGSLPIPLMIENRNKEIEILAGNIYSMNIEEVRKRFYVVVISMPETPAIANEFDLNTQFYFDPFHENKPQEIFMKSDYLENYVDRAEKVIAFLQKQDWVNSDQLVVAGHSQGTKIATKIALSNLSVTHLALFNPNPFGRIDQEIRQARLNAQLGKISWEEASSLIDDSISFYEYAVNQKNIEQDPSLIAWKSFSQPSIDDWLKISIPIYLAYGLEDTSSALCDVVPVFFYNNQKQNLTTKRYIGLEHNFFHSNRHEIESESESEWGQVMTDFLKWIN